MGGTEVWSGQNKDRNAVRNVGFQRKTSIFGAEERKSVANTANIVLMDNSDSTNGQIGKGDNRKKIVGIKEAISMFCANLPSEAYISIIAFSSRAEILCGMQPLGNNKLGIIQRVQSVSASGTTAMLEALSLSESEFRKALAGSIERVYLLTDGMSTDGSPLQVGERLKANGVQLHAIGFGDADGIDENLLQKLASMSAAGVPLYYHFTSAKNMTGFLKRESRTLTM